MINEKVLKESIKSYNDYPIPGITYFDLNPIYKEAALRDELVAGCYDIMSNLDRSKKDLWYTSYDYIAVIESRGFLIGSMLADKFNKGLILLRSKPGRLPGKTSLVKHTLEYGESQMEVQIGKGSVLVFDDVLATGGTSQAAVDVLTQAGYTPIGALFPVELTFLNPTLSIPYESVIKY